MVRERTFDALGGVVFAAVCFPRAARHDDLRAYIERQSAPGGRIEPWPHIPTGSVFRYEPAPPVAVLADSPPRRVARPNASTGRIESTA